MEDLKHLFAEISGGETRLEVSIDQLLGRAFLFFLSLDSGCVEFIEFIREPFGNHQGNRSVVEVSSVIFRHWSAVSCTKVQEGRTYFISSSSSFLWDDGPSSDDLCQCKCADVPCCYHVINL